MSSVGTQLYCCFLNSSSISHPYVLTLFTVTVSTLLYESFSSLFVSLSTEKLKSQLPIINLGNYIQIYTNKMKKSNSKNKSTSKNEVIHSLTEEGLKHYKKTGKIPVRSTVKN